MDASSGGPEIDGEGGYGTKHSRGRQDERGRTEAEGVPCQWPWSCDALHSTQRAREEAGARSDAEMPGIR